jgi:decaprenylphosphoryl-5-phosphoribose phosphatase
VTSPTSASASLAALDERVLRLARTCGHTPGRDRAMARFSAIGEHAGVWLAIGAAGTLADRARARRWRRTTCFLAGLLLLNTAVKVAVDRPRPELPDLPPLIPTPSKLGFPSAHASTSFAGALAYSRLGLPAPALYALAVALAGSRVYLGVHYPSDVVGGALLGTAAAAVAAP